MADTLADALAALQADLPHVGKDAAAIVPTKSGGTYGYKYADLATITRALMPRLAAVGLSFTACPTLESGQFVLRYTLHHAEASISGAYPLGQGTPQQMGGLITYARRYALCAVTGVAPDEDDDDAQAAADVVPIDQLRAQFNQPPEVRADGSATEAELERMRSTPTPGTWRSSGTPENDPFYDAPPSTEAKPPPSLRTMFARFAQLGITDDDKAMRLCIGNIIGREVVSRSSLTQAEVTQVNRWLLDQIAAKA